MSQLVPVQCNSCLKNFCLKHRFGTDHNCQGHPNKWVLTTQHGLEVDNAILRQPHCVSFDSSVGRAVDCRGDMAIHRSLVRIRLEGLFFFKFWLLFFFQISYRLGGARRNLPSTSRGAQSTSPRQPQANRKPQSTTLTQIGADLNRWILLQCRRGQFSGSTHHNSCIVKRETNLSWLWAGCTLGGGGGGVCTTVFDDKLLLSRERQQRQQQRQLQQYHQQPLHPTGITHASMVSTNSWSATTWIHTPRL